MYVAYIVHCCDLNEWYIYSKHIPFRRKAYILSYDFVPQMIANQIEPLRNNKWNKNFVRKRRKKEEKKKEGGRWRKIFGDVKMHETDWQQIFHSFHIFFPIWKFEGINNIFATSIQINWISLIITTILSLRRFSLLSNFLSSLFLWKKFFPPLTRHFFHLSQTRNKIHF